MSEEEMKQAGRGFDEPSGEPRADEADQVKQLEALSKEFFKHKLELDELNAKTSELNKLQERIRGSIGDIMEGLGIEKCSTEFGSHNRKVEVYPSVEDFETFLNWVTKTGSQEFVQRRVNARPVREMLLDTGEIPPGLDTYEKATVGCRISPSGRQALTA